MINTDMEARLAKAYNDLAPDVLESVLSDCQQQKGAVIFMTEKKGKRPLLRRMAGVAAAFVLVAGGLLGFNTYNTNYAVASTVALDVNPSIEIQVNEKQQVLDVIGKNEEALTVIGNMDFSGSDLNVTVNALIGSMLRNGYLSELSNSILITVDSADPAAGAALQASLAEEVDLLLQTDQFSGSVLSQTIHADASLQQLANSYGISSGKAQLIQQIAAKDSRHSVEELAALSINDLNLLVEAHGTQLDNVASTGHASEKSYVGAQAAKEAVLAHGGFTEADISFYHSELDWEDGAMIYEIEFYANGLEQEYYVSARSGEVLYGGADRDDDGYPPATVTASSEPTGTAAAEPEASAYIGREAAIAAALERAGVSETEAKNIRCELDEDDGRAVYEIEFDAGLHEYSCEVEAASGTVRDFEKDWFD